MSKTNLSPPTFSFMKTPTNQPTSEQSRPTQTMPCNRRSGDSSSHCLQSVAGGLCWRGAMGVFVVATLPPSAAVMQFRHREIWLLSNRSSRTGWCDFLIPYFSHAATSLPSVFSLLVRKREYASPEITGITQSSPAGFHNGEQSALSHRILRNSGFCTF